MNMSRFFGATNREAMRQVRLALGPDAMIVSNRRVNGGVEIIAADHEYAAADAEPAVEVQPGNEVLGAIDAMRDALENRMEDMLWGGQLRESPTAAALFQRLLESGFSTALLRAMLTRLPRQLSDRDGLQWARAELVAHLPVADEQAFWLPGQVIALVGPTGVGKTTTLAKLAARHVRRPGGGSLVLITTDTYRIGAHEQLLIYGRKLGLPVHVARNADDLARVLGSLGPQHTVLIDNMGVSQRDGRVADQAGMLAGAGRPVDRLLVLNAASQGDTLDDVARAYSHAGGSPLKGCIISKSDEAMRLGSVLDTAIRYRLPIHYVSNGQRVPEDLVLPGAASLIDQALAARRQSRPLYAPTQADLAALLTLNAAPQIREQARQTAQQRERRLAPILALAAGGAAAPSIDAAQAACRWVDEDTATAAAWQAWSGRAHTSGAGGVREGLLEALGAAQDAGRIDHDTAAGLYAAWGNGGGASAPDTADAGAFIIAHGHAKWMEQADHGGRLATAMVFDWQAAPLASAGQCLARSDGWVASWGDAASGALDPAALLAVQVGGLGAVPQLRNALHVLDAGSQSLLRSIDALGVRWLGLVTPTTPVYHEGCATTVRAVARTLAYRPADAAPALSMDAGEPQRRAWIGVADVALCARGRPALPLRLVCVRMTRADDGQETGIVYGLAPEAALMGVLPGQCAAALLSGVRGRQIARVAGQFGEHCRGWSQVGERGMDMLARTLLAAQMSAAAWRLHNCAQAQPAREMLAALPGPKNSVAHRIARLFALKETLEA
ncbi:flagellar biosynthesis protein FlhF [Pusillimonas sp. TS35]|nr:flagellar biosynthesis protein FlhF [Pusillimonas sp. TS35]